MSLAPYKTSDFASQLIPVFCIRVIGHRASDASRNEDCYISFHTYFKYPLLISLTVMTPATVPAATRTTKSLIAFIGFNLSYGIFHKSKNLISL